MTFKNEEQFIKIKHKETGKEYTNKGTDYFSFDSDKFEVISGGYTCTDGQRDEIIAMANGTGRQIPKLLEKYNRKTLKDFTFEEAESIIRFLKSLLK